jgi:hypothetical protein
VSSEATRPRKATRFRLYAPFILLAILAIGWSIAWFVIRGRVESGLDEWITAEAERGRRWACTDRKVAGYPFRIEIACASLTLERPDLAASLGRVLVVAQIYKPSHVIAKPRPRSECGPGAPRVRRPGGCCRRASSSTGARRTRVSIAADAPTISATSPEASNVDLSARRLELHVRREAAPATTLDWALSAAGAVVPGLDGLVGGTEPADIALVLAATQAGDLPARPILDRAGTLAGGRRASRSHARRPDQGRPPSRGEGLLGARRTASARRPSGGGGYRSRRAARPARGGAVRLGGRLLGALLGASPQSTIQQQPTPGNPNAPALRPLPPLRLEGGRLFLGPLPIPGVRVPPLY